MRFPKYLFIIPLLAFLLAGCSKFSKVEKSKDAAYKLQKADEYYAKKKYRNAQVLYESLFSAYKGSDKFEELYYKWAYSYYYQELYREAQQYFKSFLETFPNSKYAEEIDYMRAYSFYKESPRLELEQVNTVKAMNMMQTFINTHPGSPRIKEATEIIDKARLKLEQKDYRAAQLYYNLGQFRAAAIAFDEITDNYPESTRGAEYNLMVVKSYYKFARLSIKTKQEERYAQVVQAYDNFSDRYPDSDLLKDAEEYNNISINQIKEIQNEQTTASTKF